MNRSGVLFGVALGVGRALFLAGLVFLGFDVGSAEKDHRQDCADPHNGLAHGLWDSSPKGEEIHLDHRWL